MSNKILMSGNEAIGEGAIQAGCRFYAGYPITPQNELPAYMARRMPQVKGVFIQAESEIAAINMVLGVAAAGFRAMTSSSSPGMSLKQEGISYLAGCELPAVIVNIMRGGPGLGNIAPSQSDYFQAAKGGGHGDYHSIVLAPSTVQEAFDLVVAGFELADRYRNPVIILGDGMLGQMMEPIIIKSQIPNPNGSAKLTIGTEPFDSLRSLRANAEPVEAERSRSAKSQIKKPWALTGAKNRNPNIIRSLFLQEGKLEEINLKIQEKYRKVKKEVVLFEGLYLEDSRIVLVAYGTMARIVKGVVNRLRTEGKKIGLIRPISLWPFPQNAFTKHLRPKTKYLVVEMSYGQMVEDVKLALAGSCAVEFLGRAGGGIPTEEEIIKKIKSLKY